MTEHTKTDGLSAETPVQGKEGDEVASAAQARAKSAAKIECNACPVLCQISAGRSGACDRYANHEGVLIRVDPVLVLSRALKTGEPALVPFAPGTSDAVWSGDLVRGSDVFVTGVG
ncbi:MAG: 6-hydroxynicotinate reductase, partial [Alcaligenaceae bacterium]